MTDVLASGTPVPPVPRSATRLTQEYTHLVLDASGDCPQIRLSAGTVFTADRTRLDPLLQVLFASTD